MASPTIELDKVHKKLIRKYAYDTKDRAQAQEIQSLLNGIKLMAQSPNQWERQEGIEIVKKIQSRLPESAIIFGSSYGIFTEINLAQIVEEIDHTITGQEIENMVSRTGTQTMNVAGIDQIIEALGPEIVRLYGVKSQRYLKDQTGTKTNKLVAAPFSIARKTDNMGLQESITAQKDLTPFLSKALKALRGATFTTKAYSENFKGLERLTGVKLGKSNPLRSRASTLRSLGYSTKNIVNFLIKYAPGEQQMSDEVRVHLNHLSFIYELTGAGSIVTDTGEKEFARFLIWNEPSGLIRVASTKTIIRNLLEGQIQDFVSQYQGENWYTITFEDIKKYSNS